jgi:hypothetical protein
MLSSASSTLYSSGSNGKLRMSAIMSSTARSTSSFLLCGRHYATDTHGSARPHTHSSPRQSTKTTSEAW